MKILMVCLGNICRSPLAEGILREKARQKGLNWHIDSAGTGSWHEGELPDSRSIRTARKYGIDITYQRARQIQPSDFEHFDLILTMDQDNRDDVRALARELDATEDKVELIMNYVFPGENISVPDPYWNDDGFEAVFRMLDQACEQLVEQLAHKSEPQKI